MSEPAKRIRLSQPRTELEKVLNHRVSEQEQEYFNRDIGKKGYTLPGHNFEGPGNSLINGLPVDRSDEGSRVHDYEYFDSQWRYNEGEITQEEAEKEVEQEDSRAIYNFKNAQQEEPLAGIAGSLGLQIKKGFERLFGHKYPDFPDAPHKHPHLLYSGEEHIANEDEIEDEENQMQKSGAKRLKLGPYLKTNETVSQSTPDSTTSDTLPDSQDVEMSLTGTGKEQASGGASSDGQMTYYIEKPISIFGNKISTYTKSHKFMTFGFAPNACIGSTPAQDVYFLTSYLAEVPWHIPALYLNQSEFDLLPSGAKIKEVQVHVVYRGSTIQFETNASATGLATLNQINDIAVAEGLNRTGWGSNVKFTAFDAIQPMKPTGVAKPQYAPITGTYRGMVRDYYGSNNDAAAGLFIDDIPKHQIGRQTFLYNYWANSARSGIQPATTYRQFGGWPCLAEKIRQMDGKTVVNQVVTSMRYKPKFAPIKTPLKSVGHGMPFPEQNGIASIPIGGNLAANRQLNIQISSNAPTSSTQIEAGINAEGQILLNNFSNVPTFNIYTPIEKSQMGKSGYWGATDPHIQPSLHIGVQPVPALSSAATLTENAQFNNWTDTRAYWEVVATMVVDEHAPTAWPYATQANVPLGENVTWVPTSNQPAVNKNPRDDGSTFCGLYQLGVPDLPN